MKTYYGVDFEKQREALLKSDKAETMIEELISKADLALTKIYEPLKMTDYMIFHETGNRSTFERPYFERRNDCSYVSVAYWLTRDEKYKNTLINLIFTICDEFTWCVPAHANLHTNPSTESFITQIDLFMAETARLLTDICAAVGDLLPYYVKQRVEYEIKRRIIIPLRERHDFWWDTTCTNNWAAVCAGGCLVALLHFGAKEDIEKCLPRLYRAIDNFLKGFNDDGCCMEGYAYWNYGFGYFLIFARAIYDYTNGEVNYFDDEKVKNIAMFPQKIRMSESKNVSFSDGGSKYFNSIGAICFLKSLYGDDIVLPDLSVPKANGNVYSIKEFLWFDTDYEADSEKYLTSFFDQSQWYIKQQKKFSFAAKGGHNDEPHNHNDVGSFMIVSGENIPLTDFGCGEYVKETFMPETRYTFLVNSSRGHSVPVINGEYQCVGAEFSAKNVKAGDDYFSLDMEDAYEPGIINKIHRHFDIGESSVIMTDTFEYSEKTESVFERIVSHVKPEICDGYVNFGAADVIFDEEKFEASVSVETYRSHGNKGDVNAYLVDFRPINKKETEFKAEIRIK